MQYSSIYNAIGRVAYSIALPAMRILIRRTHRVYVLLEFKGQVLLVRNWIGNQVWHLPGGGKKRNESVYFAAIREVREEIGIDISPGDLVIIKRGQWMTDKLGFRYTVMKLNLKNKPKISPRTWEVIEAKWVAKSKIDKSILAREIREAIQ